MEYKISVIIPCYNSEATLERCINSLINQSLEFENIEVILYDDSSKDSTKQIIQEYAYKYKNIKSIYSTVNKGPGFGRNKGIEKANAEYIMFLDSDDEYDVNICKIFYDELKLSNSDLVCCGKVNLDNITTNFENNINFSRIEIEKDEINYFQEISWSRIYKKSIITNNKISFPESIYGEDFYFNCIYLTFCKSLIYFPDYIGYIRHVQTDSISRSWNLDDLNNVLKMFHKISVDISQIKPNINYSKLFKREIGTIINKLYALHLLNDKTKTIHLLKQLYAFEKEIKFNDNLEDKIFDIANKFILIQKFTLCFYYLKIIEKIYDSNLLKLIYRKFL